MQKPLSFIFLSALSCFSLISCQQFQALPLDTNTDALSAWSEASSPDNASLEPDDLTLTAADHHDWNNEEYSFEEEEALDHAYDDYVEDEHCFDDPYCVKNATHCDEQGCCRYQTCYENGRCEIYRDCGDTPGEEDLGTSYVEDADCFKNLYCYQNVTYCYFKDCCDYKTCYEGDVCSIIESSCVTAIIKGGPEIVDVAEEEACFKDPDCKRNARYCDRDGCCFTKTCDELGNCNLTGCW